MKIFLIALLIASTQLFVEDFRGESIDLRSEFGSGYIILYKGLSCQKCYTDLEDAILENDSSANVIVVFENAGLLAKKERMIHARKLVKTRKFYFEKPGFEFRDEYSSKYYPAAFYFDSFSIKFWPFDSLFNSDTKIQKIFLK